MASTEDPGRSLDGLPEMLTVCEAAAVLRIGRTLAYQLASRYLAGEAGGIPVVRIGGCLRVPLDSHTCALWDGPVLEQVSYPTMSSPGTASETTPATSRSPTASPDGTFELIRRSARLPMWITREHLIEGASGRGRCGVGSWRLG
jgi:hypothetical protein